MSVRGLARRLPDPGTLRRWAQSLAVLDAIMSPEWEYRYFSYDAAWGDGEQIASMRNGQGDDWSITFIPAGVFLRAFDHESALSPFSTQPPQPAPWLLDGLPGVLRETAVEPAFTLDGVPLITLALWRLSAGGRWSSGRGEPERANGDDGGSWLFQELDGRPETYQEFALEYYEREVPLDAVRRVFAHEPLDEGLVRAINPDVSWGEVAGDVAASGYPGG